MKKAVAFNGSPRKNGNTTYLLQQFLEGFSVNNGHIEEFSVQETNLKYCTGCLRCNILKRCSLTGDDWQEISDKMMEADVLVFASPIYFHHVTAPLKKLIDRFRSFIKVQITETGLNHIPHAVWKKDFVLLLCMGSSDSSDARPVIDLFEYMINILGNENKLHVITATRLAVVKQITKTEEELKVLYPKLSLPVHLIKKDIIENRKVLERCRELGIKLSQI